jgi:hypothetical protein
MPGQSDKEFWQKFFNLGGTLMVVLSEMSK